MKYEQEISFENKTSATSIAKKMKDEAESIAEEMQTNNFAIISACNRSMSKEETITATDSLVSDFENEFEKGKIKNILMIPIQGHYKYSDGTMADERSMMFSSETLTKEFVEKVAKKYNQESYIYNMVLYDTKTGEAILKFNKIIIKDTSFFEKNGEENYSTLGIFPEISFKFE